MYYYKKDNRPPLKSETEININGFISIDETEYNSLKQVWKIKTNNLNRIQELKRNLANTDYQAIKYAEGQLSESEYASMKAQRQAWRDEINQLEQTLA